MVHSLFLIVTGNEKITSLGTPYEPSDITPMDTQQPGAVPFQMSFIWSPAALAADMADDNFLAAITAAPRFCIV